MKKISILLSTFCFLIGCQDQSDSNWVIEKYIMDSPKLTYLNLGDSSQSHGDELFYEANLRDTAGNVVGEALGHKMTVDIMDGDSTQPVYKTVRTGMSFFDFGDENQLMVDGHTLTRKGEQKMIKGLPQKLGIIGGTGRYKGVRGELTATPNENGTYTFVFEMKQ
jgi:hypothetical protein